MDYFGYLETVRAFFFFFNRNFVKIPFWYLFNREEIFIQCLIELHSIQFNLIIDSIYFTYIQSIFGIGGDCMENTFWRTISLSKMLCFEYFIILCGTNNTNRDLPLGICLIEVGKYFQERPLKVKTIISGIFPRGECWSVSRIIVCKINDILSEKCFLLFLLLTEIMAGPGKMECITLICILKITSF